MGLPTIIYGHIQAHWGVQETEKHLRRHNLRVLQHLPAKDQWPPLIQKMFGITGPSVLDGSYDVDIIHFGASLKNLDLDDGPQWIEKFERLLRQLYWFEAVMHIDWIYEPRLFRWKAVRPMTWTLPTRPVEQWTFEDGGFPLGTR